MIDWELVDWDKKETKILEYNDPHWSIMLIGMLPIYISFIVFIVWVITKLNVM